MFNVPDESGTNDRLKPVLPQGLVPSLTLRMTDLARVWVTKWRLSEHRFQPVGAAGFIRWKRAADLNGGVFLAWAGSRNYQKPVTVQHLSSDGSLSMAANGVSLDTANSYGTSLLIRPDNSVVLAWDVEYGVRANVVNSSGDLLWDETMVIPSTNKYPRVALNAFGDDNFALCFVNGEGLHCSVSIHPEQLCGPSRFV